MKHILISLFILTTFKASAQEWTTYMIDNIVSVDVPEGFEVVDTLGVQMAKAMLDNALVMTQRVPNGYNGNTVKVSNREDLRETYKGFQDGVTKAQNGTLIKQTNETWGGLEVTKFSIRASMMGEQQIRHFFACFVNETWYIIQFWEVEALTDDLSVNRNKLFYSIKFSELATPDKQFNKSMTDDLGYNLGRMLGYSFFAGIVGLIIWGAVKLVKLMTGR